MIRARWLLLLSALAALAIGGAAFASGSAVPTTLKLVGTADCNVGDSAR